jgi:hypothetical protein
MEKTMAYNNRGLPSFRRMDGECEIHEMYGFEFIPADIFDDDIASGNRKPWRLRETDNGRSIFVGLIVYPKPEVYYSRLTARRKGWANRVRTGWMRDGSGVIR